MPNVNELNPPLHYSSIWLLGGMALLAIIAAWLVFVVWLTRHKSIKTVADLAVLPPNKADLETLKKRYLEKIVHLQQQYEQKQIDTRQLHQQLSLMVRTFVYEVIGFPAPKLTLADITMAKQAKLAAVIAAYYPDEFDTIAHDEPNVALATAKEMVAAWD